MIRQGLRVMAQRSPVEISEILDCKNGEEALEILRGTEVDVMFTDVRMPNMDGITLVQRLQTLPHPPLTVIISGYDDFSYAVEALRCGAKEYLLKPVEREDISQVLQRLEGMLQESQKSRSRPSPQGVGCQPLKYFLLNPNVTTSEREAARVLFESWVEKGPYLVAACREKLESPGADLPFLCLENVDDTACLYLIREPQWPHLAATCFAGKKAGLSRPQTDFSQLPEACRIAVECWTRAFLTDAELIQPNGMPEQEAPPLSQEDAARIAQLIGTEKLDQVQALLDKFFLLAGSGKLSGVSFSGSIANLLHQVETLYRNKLANRVDRLHPLYHPYSYPSLQDFQTALWNFLTEANKSILQQHSASRKTGKMEEAVAYIQQNYQRDLNMAMVSNHISVSYSFFSQAFKEYTGMNFINYLKDLRIQHAKELLVTTDLHIAEISLQAGFENEKHFMKVFRSMVGVSPTEYRRNTGKKS